jgi:coenzyme F420 biosynthesis associated uncharacterized protein
LSGLVDWGLAGRVAALVAGEDPATGPRRSDEQLRAAVADSAGAVTAYTGLEPRDRLPEGEWVTRRAWAAIALGSMRESLSVVESELAGRIGSGGRGASVASAAIGRVTGVQVGALVGLGSRRVLGQYEFPLLAPAAREPRLLFVAANIGEAQDKFDADPESVLRWIALHEVTHAVHFGATPWLADHLGELAGRLLRESSLELRPGEILAAARSTLGTDPREIVRQLRASDPLTLLSPPRSRELLAAVQAAMASIEGFAEHVMDAAAPLIGEDVAGMRVQMERRRRDRSPLARLLAWLLGMELKMRQYRDGKAFCDAVVAEAGIGGLNRAWDAPEQLPTQAEIKLPAAWVERTRSASQAAA